MYIVYGYVYVHIYIYIYIQRERERLRNTVIDKFNIVDIPMGHGPPR